jgi:hypothetical protein
MGERRVWFCCTQRNPLLVQRATLLLRQQRINGWFEFLVAVRATTNVIELDDALLVQDHRPRNAALDQLIHGISCDSLSKEELVYAQERAYGMGWVDGDGDEVNRGPILVYELVETRYFLNAAAAGGGPPIDDRNLATKF